MLSRIHGYSGVQKQKIYFLFFTECRMVFPFSLPSSNTRACREYMYLLQNYCSVKAAPYNTYCIYKGLNITSALIIFWLANLYHIAFSRRSIIKTYSVRLHMEDSFRTFLNVVHKATTNRDHCLACFFNLPDF